MMRRRQLFMAMMTAIGLLFFVSTASAEVILGKMKSSLEGKLVITDKDGNNEQTFTPDRNTRITLNGERSKLDKLTPGCDVTVTTGKKDGATVVKSIEAQSANETIVLAVRISP